MAKLLKLRRGTTSQHSSFTGAEGEVTVDTTKDTLVVHDGSTAGGHELLREDMSNLPAGTIDNADVNASAAIAGTKISPDFGSQNITTTGLGTFAGELRANGNLKITNSGPKVTFTDAEENPDFEIGNLNGVFRIRDATNSANRIVVNTDGHVDVTGNLDVGAGLDVTGAVTTTGNITTTGQINIESTSPRLHLADSNSEDDFSIYNQNGDFKIYNEDDNRADMIITSDGQIDFAGNVDCNGGLDVIGNIAVSGTVDGRDVAADGGKLDGIATGATNVSTENIQDVVGAMVSGNTESGITVTYQDGDGTLDFTIGTLNQNTTGNAGTATQLQNARTIAGSSFNGTANIDISYNNLTNKPTIPSNNNQLTNGAGYITSASFSDVAGGGTFTGDVTFDGGANAVVIAGDSEIKFNNGNWTGNHTKIQHHGNFLYLVGGSSGIIFREGGNDRVKIDGSGHLVPASNNTYNLGSTSLRWSNVYTNDLHLSNEGSCNDVDSTWGDWTIQEGESDLFLKNNRSGKKYKFNLTEVS